MTVKSTRLDNGWELAVYETATSTSDVIFSHPEPHEGLCVLAREQTKGRGRLGRAWRSERNDGMYLSLALTPSRPVQEWPALSFIAALALLQSLKSLYPDLPVGLKWPNDVLVGGKKLSGILAEAKGGVFVLGCGLNLKNAPALRDATFPPTDLATVTGEIIAPEVIAIRFLTRFHYLYQEWQVSGFSAQYDLYKSHLLFLSEKIAVTQGENRISGIMLGVTKTGDLLLELADGSLKAITTGDVNLVRFSDASGN